MRKILCRLVMLILVSEVASSRAEAGVEIPANLSRNDVGDVIKILGHNTGGKFLSNPYSLGGYSGFEVGVSVETIDTSDLSRLGDGTGDQSNFQYNRISFGKGLYNNIDIFVHFVPFSNANEVSEYGTMLKWNFYQAKFLPFSLSLLGSYSSIDIQDKFVNENTGLDLMGGINLNRFALYWGAGVQRARGTFSQTVLDLTDPNNALNSTNTLVIRNSHAHSFVGVQVEIDKIFLAGQIDRYDQPVYSGKLGLRF